jgi:hypothetical protein
MAQLVAHHTGSVGVRGSNPLSSTQKPQFTGLRDRYSARRGTYRVLYRIDDCSRRVQPCGCIPSIALTNSSVHACASPSAANATALDAVKTRKRNRR